MKIYIRLYKKGRIVKRLTADRSKWRKLYHRLASAHAEKYLVRVEYGKAKTNFDKTIHYTDGTVTKPIEMFYNEYQGESLKEAKQALKAFIE